MGVPGMATAKEQILRVLQTRLKAPRTRPELRATEGGEGQVCRDLGQAPDSSGTPNHSMPPGYKEIQDYFHGSGDQQRPGRFRPASASQTIPRGVGGGSIP